METAKASIRSSRGLFCRSYNKIAERWNQRCWTIEFNLLKK